MTGLKIYHFAVRNLSAFEAVRLGKKQLKGSVKIAKPSVLAVGSLGSVAGVISIMMYLQICFVFRKQRECLGFFSWKVSLKERCYFLGDIGAFFPPLL